MEKNNYQELEHTADWALWVRGADFEQLLINAAKGMLELVGAKPAAESRGERVLELEAPDREGLLVAWLEELLFSMESDSVTFTDFELELDADTHLVARVQEAPLADLRKEIKAVTYHNLEIKPSEQGLEVTVVFDV